MLLHRPGPLKSAFDTVVKIAVVIDLQASRSRTIKKSVQIVLRVRWRIVTDLLLPIVILVFVVSRFGEA